MADHPSSKSQERALRLFNLSADGTYAGAEDVLIRFGVDGAGLPYGHTWRSAAKLSDDQILALLSPQQANAATDHDTEGPRVAAMPHLPMSRRQISETDRRTADNRAELAAQKQALKRAGYRWIRNDDYAVGARGEDEFVMLDPNGAEVSMVDALQTIGYRR